MDPGGPYTGTVKVSVYDVEEIGGSLTLNGSAVPVVFTAPGQKASLTFAGVAGRRYSVFGKNVTGGCLCWPLAVKKPNGSPWKTTNSCGDVFFEPDVAPDTGTYTVLVDPNGTTTGTVQLSVYDVVDLTGALTVNDPVLPVSITQRGQVARYTFAGAAGQPITVRLTGNSMWTTLVSLLRPDPRWRRGTRPWSEWCGRPASGHRRFSAISSAVMVRWRSLTAPTAHPTMNREKRSTIAAR